MSTFPRLDSGSVCQYPTRITHQQAVQVLRYLDGSDQRFLRQGRQFRRWQIRLDLLSETELASLEAFFESCSGDYSSFTFPDPFSGTLVSHCYLADASMETTFTGCNRGVTSLWVVEANG